MLPSELRLSSCYAYIMEIVIQKRKICRKWQRKKGKVEKTKKVVFTIHPVSLFKINFKLIKNLWPKTNWTLFFCLTNRTELERINSLGIGIKRRKNEIENIYFMATNWCSPRLKLLNWNLYKISIADGPELKFII